MKVPFLVIGGGLSGLAAAIRAARFTPNVLLLEKHLRIGGLNSYFYRHGNLYETGLHAITNYAEPTDKKAPLNRLLRQLKLPKNRLSFCPQYQSEVVFQGRTSLKFSNDFKLLHSEINTKFPQSIDKFSKLLVLLKDFDPFIAVPFRSAKRFLLEILQDPLLVEMLLCPLMYYGSSREDDMDLAQFAIMFQAIYLEGMFRPQESIKEFLDLLVDHYLQLGGSVKTSCGVEKILHSNNRAIGVILSTGEHIACDYILSTIGHKETMRLLDNKENLGQTATEELPRLGFFETIYQVPEPTAAHLPKDKTIIFYNNGEHFAYRRPQELVDFRSGVICFPGNFQGAKAKERVEIRSTHLAHYAKWQALAGNPAHYQTQKKHAAELSGQHIESIIGSFTTNIVYENSFTPVTIERYTAKIEGAIYGSPTKIKDGNIGFTNLFLAGTDQGFLGIVGSMLSGVSIVNQHILPRL